MMEIFDSKNNITLLASANNRFISGTLFQKCHPEMYVFRRLKVVEFNYSNVEKGDLAIAWENKRVHHRQFLPLRKCNHRPLEF